jgi:hypothetical protein
VIEAEELPQGTLSVWDSLMMGLGPCQRLEFLVEEAEVVETFDVAGWREVELELGASEAFFAYDWGEY